MLELRRGMEEEQEKIAEEQEADYVYDDELEEIRISTNYLKLVKELFLMLQERKTFTLLELNGMLEMKFGKRLFANGDYYSFLVNLCQKHDIVIKEAVRRPATNFEAVLKQYFEAGGTDEEMMLDFHLETMPDEKPIEFAGGFSVTNIRFERTKIDDRTDIRNGD